MLSPDVQPASANVQRSSDLPAVIGVGTRGVCTEPFDALLKGRQAFADTSNGALDWTYRGPLIHCSASYGGSAP